MDSNSRCCIWRCAFQSSNMLLFALSSILEQKPINSHLVCVHMYTENDAYGLWQSPDFPSRHVNILSF